MKKTRDDNEHLYLQATEEFESNDIDEALWAKALTIARGDTQAAMYEYIEMRVSQLEDEQPAEPYTENLSRAADQLEEPKADVAANSLPPKTLEDTPPSPADWLSQLKGGDFGLARTYWLYGIVLSNLALLIPYFFLFEGQTLAAQITMLIYCICAFVVLIGIWNAASKYTGSKVWAILAKISTIIGAANLISAGFIIFAI